MGRGGGLVVGVLAFCSIDLSLDVNAVYSF